MGDTTYTVIKKEEFAFMNRETNEVETNYRIIAKSKGGTRFHVVVTEKELEEGKSEERLSQRAQRLDAIK